MFLVLFGDHDVVNLLDTEDRSDRDRIMNGQQVYTPETQENDPVIFESELITHGLKR